jgi:hypothetical protein
MRKIGAIGLPLSVRDAQAIAAICKQSSFGKGGETFVDEDVRRTWQLDIGRSKCCNPAWQSYLVSSPMYQAIQRLGVQVAVALELYKLLLYEEAAFFQSPPRN